MRSSRSRVRLLGDYILSLMVVSLATVCGLLVRDLLAPTNIAMIYLLAVVLSATTWGLGPSIFSSIASVFAFDILFVPPYGTLAVHDTQYFLTFGIFLVVAVIISELGARVRRQVALAQEREHQSAALYALTRGIAFVTDLKKILDTASQEIKRVFDTEPILLLAAVDRQLIVPEAMALSAAAREAARRAVERRQSTGWSTGSFSESEYFFQPLFTAQRVWGVLGLRQHEVGTTLSQDRRRLVEMFAAQIAIALDHLELSAQAEQARLLEESERFRNALLSSISHDLRTPLAAILGSVTSLLDKRTPLPQAAQHDLLLTIEEETARLNRLVANLLNMTQLESGTLAPRCDWHSIEEVVGSALAHARANDRAIEVNLQRDLPLVPFDFVLIEQVLLNLLDNALKFSPAHTPIEISAQRDGAMIRIQVADRGVGIPSGESQRIFEKFYRLPQNSVPGVGLGLSICKGIVEAHHGGIWAESRPGGGTAVTFTLPAPAFEPRYE